MSATRICMFVHNFFRHDTRVLKEASTLAAAGYEVRVVAARDDETPPVERLAGFTVVRVPSDPLPARLLRRYLALHGRGGAIGTVAAPPDPQARGPRPALGRAALRAHLLLEYLKFARKAAAAARAEPADVYVAHDLDTLPVAWWAARRDGGRVLYDSHELFVERAAVGRLGRLVWRALEQRLIRAADRVMTVSDSVALELARRYGVPKPLVLRNLPDAPATPPEEGSPLRGELGIAAGARVAIYLGGLQGGRGLEQLIESAALLEDVVLVLMGPGHARYVERLRATAASAGAGARVVLAAPVPAADVIRWVAGADVGVAPIQHESLNNYYSLPNKLFDYIAAGLPVVASDFPELKRVVDGCGVGATCRPDDPADIARALRWVLEDPERHVRLSAAAREAARELTWEHESGKLLDAVAELARDRDRDGYR